VQIGTDPIEELPSILVKRPKHYNQKCSKRAQNTFAEGAINTKKQI
jgi:hypothetical protein